MASCVTATRSSRQPQRWNGRGPRRCGGRAKLLECGNPLPLWCLASSNPHSAFVAKAAEDCRTPRRWRDPVGPVRSPRGLGVRVACHRFSSAGRGNELRGRSTASLKPLLRPCWLTPLLQDAAASLPAPCGVREVLECGSPLPLSSGQAVDHDVRCLWRPET